MEADEESGKATIRMAKPPGSYRHGDLRNALTAAATELTVQRGGPDFTLREIAARTGVRHAAVYRHFASKSALLERIADQGVAALDAQLRAKVDAAEDALQALELIVTTYVSFAIERPGEYRVMFMAQNANATESPRTSLIALLQDSVSRAQQDGFLRDDIDSRLLTNLLWAKLHGLAMLVLDSAITQQEVVASRDAVFNLWRQGANRG